MHGHGRGTHKHWKIVFGKVLISVQNPRFNINPKDRERPIRKKIGMKMPHKKSQEKGGCVQDQEKGNRRSGVTHPNRRVAVQWQW